MAGQDAGGEGEVNIMETKEEMEIRQLFVKCGYDYCKLDIDQTAKRPDYLFTKENFKFVAEVKVLEEQDEMNKDDIITRKMKELIESLSIDYNLSFNTSHDYMEQNIKWNKIKQFLMEQFGVGGLTIGTKRSFHNFDFKVSGINCNKKPAALGICGLAKKCNAVDCIRDDIKDAVKKYKTYSKTTSESIPLLVIIYKKRFIYDDEDLINAMYGDTVVHIRKDNLKVDHLSRKNAALQRQKNTSISAMAIYDEGKLSVLTKT